MTALNKPAARIAKSVGIAARDIVASLRRDGYCVAHAPVDDRRASRFVLDIALSLGKLYVPKGCKPSLPLIRTVPTRVQSAAPFDRPQPIGWHGDFATHEDRPELSIVYVTRPDPRGGNYGAWRLASVAQTVDALRATRSGRAAFDFLSHESLPFSYSEGESPRWFRVIESRPDGRLGLRFYLPSLRRGCLAEYLAVPRRITSALSAVERAADDVAEIVPTKMGSLLVANNWYALHDRERQTISRSRPNREALLCFVAQSNQALDLQQESDS